MSDASTGLLPRLIGDRLIAVTFVLNDYLQLEFDAARMTIYEWPSVCLGARTWRVHDLGYADMLKRLCGETVQSTSEEPGDGLRIVLERGQLHINPAGPPGGPEIALLQLDPGPGADEPGDWMCWRVDEDPFENLCPDA